MELNELLTWFDQGGQFGDDPEIVACMRRYIQENRRLLFEMNSLWHEDENEITELFRKITAKPVGEGVRIETPFHTDFGKNITLGNRVFINAGCKFQDQGGIVIGGG
jgi:acetyltransferase-like isoleucine patch superfamily enzyme